MPQKKKVLYVVHAVDTEGPLYQSPKATILRVNELFGTHFEPSVETINKLRRKEIDVNGREDEIANYLSTTDFLSDKKSYSDSINEVTCEKFREKYSDPQSGHYRFSWYILDNVATLINPRRRLFGYGFVYFNLLEAMKFEKSLNIDGFYMHYHQMRKDQHPFVKEPNFFSSDEYNQIICRNIIEQRRFPASYRAGYCLERWEVNLWLENWIPFDYSNEAPAFSFSSERRIKEEIDFWLRAPNDWSHYNPDSHDYEVPGNLRRTIFRSLCFRTTLYSLTEEDVRKAFMRADSGFPTVLSCFSHDFRRLEPEAKDFHDMIVKVAKAYPEVKWYNANAVEASRGVLGYTETNPFKLDLFVDDNVVYAKSSRDVFGSEPFLALQTVDHRFFNQCFVKIEDRLWGYNLNHPEIIWRIGIGANDRAGYSDTVLLEKRDGEFVKVEGTGYWSGSPE